MNSAFFDAPPSSAAPVCGRLGAYRLISPLGRGGMGQVYLALDPEARKVALKILPLRGKLEGERVRRAFRNEVRAVAELDHPHIIRILDRGEVQPTDLLPVGTSELVGSPYFVMELARRGSLERRCGTLPWGATRAVLLTLLDALAHAHARGVIHLDIKPENVLQGSEDDDRAGLKLTDFGVAHRWEMDPSGLDRLGGTPEYMPPEQQEARVQDFGPWTDLFALGRLAIALLEGDPLGSGSLNDRAPPGLHAWLARVLDPRAERRFPTAADAAWELSALPEGDGAEIQKESALLEHTSLTCTLQRTVTSVQATKRLSHSSPDSYRRQAPPLPVRGQQELPTSVPPFPPTWRGSEGTAQTAPGTLSLFGLRPVPLVGRESERDGLWSALGSVVRDKGVNCVVLQGAAGTGKTRLARWLGERAEELGVVRCLRAVHAAVPSVNDGLGPMLRRFLRCEGLSLQQLDTRLGNALESWDAQDRLSLAKVLSPAESPALAPDSQRTGAVLASERHALFARVLKQLSSDRPVLVLLDDVQWGKESLTFVEGLLAREQVETGNVLFVLTAREEALAERPAESEALRRLVGSSRVQAFSILPLRAEEHHDLVARLAPLQPSLVTHVAERTLGNPLFAIQLVGDWVERSLLCADPSGLRLTEGADTSIPTSVSSFWEGRLNRLLAGPSDEQGWALELAAFLGPEVEAGLWEQVCSLRGLTTPWELLDLLLDQRLAHAESQGGRWSFVHGMLRESLEQRAHSGGRSHAHHEACAVVLARQGAPAETLGAHWLGAGRPLDALPLLREATRRRLTEGDYTRAEALLAFWDSALVQLEQRSEDPARLEWSVLRSRCDRGLGRYEQARAEAELVLGAPATEQTKPLIAEAHLALAELCRVQGEPERALSLLGRAETLLTELPAKELLWECRLDTARILLNQPGRLAEARHYGDLALQQAPGVEERARSLLYRGEVDRQAGDFAAARGRFLEAKAGFEQCDARLGVALCHNVLGELARYENSLQEAEAHYREAHRALLKLGSDHRLQPEVNLGLVLLEQRRFQEARPILTSALRTFERRRIPAMAGAMHLCLLPCSADVEDWKAWDWHLQQATAIVQETGFIDIDNARAAQLGGSVAQARGASGRALEAFRLAFQQWSALGKPEEAKALQDLMEELKETRKD